MEGGHLLRNYQTIKDINKFTLYPYYSRKRGRRVGTLTQGGHLFDILPKGWVLIRGRLLFDHGHLFKGGACLTMAIGVAHTWGMCMGAYSTKYCISLILKNRPWSFLIYPE